MGPDETVCVATDDKTDGGGITPRLLNQPVGDDIDLCGGRYGAHICEINK